MEHPDTKAVAVAYIEAAGANDLERLAELIAPDVTFKGPFSATTSAETFVAGLQRMRPIWVRNEITGAFSNGDRACVVYDFVTNTAVGVVPCVEAITVRDGRVAATELFFDTAAFAPAAAELRK